MKTFKEFKREQVLQEFKIFKPSMKGEMTLIGFLGSLLASNAGQYIAYKKRVAQREKEKMGCDRDPWPE